MKNQRDIDVSNLRFYSEMFRQHEWSTCVIHWGVFEQTLKEIADRIEQPKQPSCDACDVVCDGRCQPEQPKQLEAVGDAQPTAWMYRELINKHITGELRPGEIQIGEIKGVPSSAFEL